MTKPILCLDFDGVIHSYTSGWKGEDKTPDPMVPGAMEFIIAASEFFTIAVHSSRSKTVSGMHAMQEFMRDNWIDAGYDDHRWQILKDIQWPTTKPAAFLTIDDRAIEFNGQWPDPKTLLDFKPWNKGGKTFTEIDQAYSERNHLVALLARLYPSGLRKTNIPSWDPQWRNCVYIDLPTGQISYHYRDSEMYLFEGLEGLPDYHKPWDGHTKVDVHNRIREMWWYGNWPARAEAPSPVMEVIERGDQVASETSSAREQTVDGTDGSGPGETTGGPE